MKEEMGRECWACGADLIWGGDHDEEDADGVEYIASNLSCSKCDAFYLVYLPLDINSQGPEGT